MLDRQRLWRNGRGLSLLVVGTFLALSLLGYDPADAPGSACYPPNGSDGSAVPLSNPCGPVGASIAHGLYTAIGWACLLLLPAWGVVTVRVLLGRPIGEPAARLAGLAMLVGVASASLQELRPGLAGSPPVGSGGYAGALIAGGLRGQFGPIGMALVLGSAAVIGLALVHDLVYSPASRRRVHCSPTAAGVVPRPSDTLPAIPRPRADLPSPASPSGPPAPPASPSRGAPAPAAPSAPNAPAVRPAAPPSRLLSGYQAPPMDLLEPTSAIPIHEREASIQARALMLEKTLLEHGCQVRVVQIDTGPVITQFEIELEAGLRVSKIVGLANDLAIALAVPSVRIVAPIPGKTTVGIEVPNERRSMVRLREVIEGVGAGKSLVKAHIPLFLGKDVKGSPLAFDLAEMPHLLIAGRTGTGKSVCLNAMITSILMTRRPEECKLILIDPKMVELSQYKQVPHLMHPVVTDMKKAESLLAWACEKMDERYTYLARAGVRSLHIYNQLGAEEIYNRLQPEDEEERQRIPTYMPHIVIVVDEMSDMMMTAAKEVEAHIVRLAQKARAVGMHLIVATQKPTVDVITGLIKGNLPARIAFQVSSRGDSRVVLDEMGAEKLLGNGDMLFLIPGTSHLVRAQGTYVSDAEVERICDYLSQFPQEFSKELMKLRSGGAGGKDGGALKDRDELYEAAIDIIVREQRGSCSLLQRALGIGYGRAARLIDFMAEDGIVGEYKSGAAREVLYTVEEWEALKNGEDPPEGLPGEAAA
ncbi:DNA translocase FtsK [Tautonia sociabilis]|uniref:DNA translocase FtsK n=1 Tax=Tautonia sociabilis TaxID=2080755 RepID=A0A432MM80_9BACT|nr:DNA translocase FtsK [Tautonia sociabilis]RUL88235.1 DNA translocase FtsK [Tautonia sociabilis]